MTEIVAVLGGALLFALFGWIALRASRCSLEQGGGGSCSGAMCHACPRREGASEETDGSH